MDNMLYGAIVRSPAKSGIITSISHGDLPEGYSLFTARDIPGNNLVDTPFGKVPVFSEGNISYKGEPLGILVGPNENKVYELLSEIEIVFDSNTIEAYLKSFESEYKRPVLPMPDAVEHKKSNADIDAISRAMNLEAVPFSPDSIVKEHEQANKNQIFADANAAVENEMFSVVLASRSIEKGPCFAADPVTGITPGLNSVFNQASYVVEGSWTDSMHTPLYGEPNGAICMFSGEYLTVYTPTQWISDLRRVLTQSLHIDPSKIIIKKTNSSNHSTNSIWYNSIIACQVATAALHTGCSVKLVYSREEQDSFMEKMHPITIAHKTAVDDKGHITAMQINIDVDAGSSNPFIQEILDRLVIASYGCYNPLNLSVSATAYRSSKPSSSIELQLIDTPAFFAVENQLYDICLLSGLTPAEIRKANIVQCNGDSNNTPFSFTLEKPGEVIDALVSQCDFNRKYASYHLDAVLRQTRNEKNDLESPFEAPLRGIGFSCGFEGSGYFGSGVYKNDQTMEVTLEADNTLTIHCPPVSASIKDIWVQTAASILNIATSAVHINSEFAAHEEPPLPESVYSNISVMMTLLKKCCESLTRRNPSTPLPMTVKKTTTSTQRRVWDDEAFKGAPFHSTAFAAGAVELELDPCTFREHIRGIWVVVNGGKILSAKAAESTIKLCIQKVFASLIEDETISCNNIHVSFLQSTSDPMQIGELVYQVLPSAFTQALSQALGCTVNILPLCTDSLYNHLCDKNEHDNAMERAALLNQKKAERHTKPGEQTDFDLDLQQAAKQQKER